MTEKDIKIQVRSEVKELLLNGYIDQLLIDKCVEITLKAINYTRFFTEVCEDETHETTSKLEDAYICECGKLKIY
jgi:hypothetical protein